MEQTETKQETAQTLTGVRLDIGCGLAPRPGYVGVDAIFGGKAYPLEYADASVDEIRASHILEHFSHRATIQVLRDWVRVLRPGGKLRVAVPDFKVCAEAYLSGKPVDIQGYVMGAQTNVGDFHGAIFDEEELRAALKQAGLTNIRKWSDDSNDCSSLPVSLNLEGAKDAPLQLRNVSAVMTLPRFGPTWLTRILEQLRVLNMPYTESHGVFWGQALTLAIETALRTNPDYILVIDYDTVFEADDVRELYRLMQTCPNVAAVCATQMGRDRDTVLITIQDGKGEAKKSLAPSEVNAELLPVATANFGLTMIRADVFRKLPKPWFRATPNERGEWTDGRTDEDIHFWRQLAASGMSVCQANRVVVGHLQWTCTWPKRDLSPLHQFLTDYMKSGKPREVYR